ncbi:MAG TPA: tetratricopeptide repeat protein [Steroidobacteraceae bacterium]|nr:tetratricopeptide repeat protein [Steroidobacteraceae bacterium]
MMKAFPFAVLLTCALAGCAVPPPYSPPSRPAPAPAPTAPAESRERPAAPPLSVEDPTPTYSPGTARPGAEAPVPAPYTLGPASEALVSQARTQAAAGDYAVAAGTIERALRIEPENPLLWIELGRVRLVEGNAAQAESVGRKAASMARGDPRAEATAWLLVAEALQQRGRTAEAIEAESRARALRTR